MTAKQWVILVKFMIFMMNHTLKNWGPAPIELFEKDHRVMFLRVLENEVAGHGG